MSAAASTVSVPVALATGADPILSVRDLRTYFEQRHATVKAVDGVSFELHAGETVGLVGESGSGKSVTGYSLLGLIDAPGRIVGGSVRLAGEELVGRPTPGLRAVRGRHLAMIFQDPMATLNPVLTIGAQMQLALQAHGRVPPAQSRARCVEVLRQVGIPDPAKRLEAWPHQFSGGMRQRVAIAIALLHKPRVIVADEPTTALDVSIQAQILTEIHQLVRESGTALLWISHDLATVAAIAQRVLVMYAGRIVEEGPTRAVLKAPRHPYTAGLLGSLPQSSTPGQPLAQIPGSPPPLDALPAGCSFADRCARAESRCREAAPPRVSDGERAWRCHFPIHHEASSATAADASGTRRVPAP
jgi:peptide/nickel transport system ATP-binding protein